MTRQLRVKFVAALLAMQAVTVLAIIIGGALITRPALVEQMSQLMDREATSAAQQASARLESQRQVAQQAADLLGEGVVDPSSDETLAAIFRADVTLDDEIAGMYLGRDDGSLVYVGRDGSKPGAVTKTWIISLADGQRRSTSTWHDAAGTVVAVEEDPTDTFDPRTRPWYTAAAETRAPVWTDPYIFVTDHEPGVTTAAPVLTAGAVTGVVGVDLGLAELSQIVGAIDVSDNGRAILLQDDGTLVAHPDPFEIVRGEGEEVRNAQIGELQDPVAQAGYEALRDAGELATTTTDPDEPTTTVTAGETPSGTEIQNVTTSTTPSGDISETFDVGDETYQVVVAPLTEPAGWFVAITAPETDFVGEIVAAEQKTALIAVAVGLAVVVLAMPLVRIVSNRFGRLQQRANVDALTGLVNRHVFGESLEREVARAAAPGARHPLSAAQIDVDFFKHVNDTYGHAAGDQALTVVAKRLAHGVRDRDIVARLGGDEFAVLLVDADEEEAAHIMERIRAAIEAEPVETADGTLVPITITVGVAQLPTGEALAELTASTGDGAGSGDGDGTGGGGASAGAAPTLGEQLMDLADQGLYVAKEGGRNKVASRTAVLSGGRDPVGTPR